MATNEDDALQKMNELIEWANDADWDPLSRYAFASLTTGLFTKKMIKFDESDKDKDKDNQRKYSGHSGLLKMLMLAAQTDAAFILQGCSGFEIAAGILGLLEGSTGVTVHANYDSRKFEVYNGPLIWIDSIGIVKDRFNRLMKSMQSRAVYNPFACEPDLMHIKLIKKAPVAAETVKNSSDHQSIGLMLDIDAVFGAIPVEDLRDVLKDNIEMNIIGRQPGSKIYTRISSKSSFICSSSGDFVNVRDLPYVKLGAAMTSLGRIDIFLVCPYYNTDCLTSFSTTVINYLQEWSKVSTGPTAFQMVCDQSGAKGIIYAEDYPHIAEIFNGKAGFDGCFYHIESFGNKVTNQASVFPLDDPYHNFDQIMNKINNVLDICKRVYLQYDICVSVSAGTGVITVPTNLFFECSGIVPNYHLFFSSRMSNASYKFTRIANGELKAWAGLRKVNFYSTVKGRAEAMRKRAFPPNLGLASLKHTRFPGVQWFSDSNKYRNELRKFKTLGANFASDQRSTYSYRLEASMPAFMIYDYLDDLLSFIESGCFEQLNTKSMIKIINENFNGFVGRFDSGDLFNLWAYEALLTNCYFCGKNNTCLPWANGFGSLVKSLRTPDVAFINFSLIEQTLTKIDAVIKNQYIFDFIKSFTIRSRFTRQSSCVSMLSSELVLTAAEGVRLVIYDYSTCKCQAFKVDHGPDSSYRLGNLTKEFASTVYADSKNGLDTRTEIQKQFSKALVMHETKETRMPSFLYIYHQLSIMFNLEYSEFDALIISYLQENQLSIIYTHKIGRHSDISGHYVYLRNLNSIAADQLVMYTAGHLTRTRRAAMFKELRASIEPRLARRCRLATGRLRWSDRMDLELLHGHQRFLRGDPGCEIMEFAATDLCYCFFPVVPMLNLRYRIRNYKEWRVADKYATMSTRSEYIDLTEFDVASHDQFLAGFGFAFTDAERQLYMQIREIDMEMCACTKYVPVFTTARALPNGSANSISLHHNIPDEHSEDNNSSSATVVEIFDDDGCDALMDEPSTNVSAPALFLLSPPVTVPAAHPMFSFDTDKALSRLRKSFGSSGTTFTISAVLRKLFNVKNRPSAVEWTEWFNYLLRIEVLEIHGANRKTSLYRFRT
jgi:hypothetical protein